jgi:hypothetical protein
LTVLIVAGSGLRMVYASGYIFEVCRSSQSLE